MAHYLSDRPIFASLFPKSHSSQGTSTLPQYREPLTGAGQWTPDSSAQESFRLDLQKLCKSGFNQEPRNHHITLDQTLHGDKCLGRHFKLGHFMRSKRMSLHLCSWTCCKRIETRIRIQTSGLHVHRLPELLFTWEHLRCTNKTS